MYQVLRAGERGPGISSDTDTSTLLRAGREGARYQLQHNQGYCSGSVWKDQDYESQAESPCCISIGPSLQAPYQ